MNHSSDLHSATPLGASDDWLDRILASDAADHRADYIRDEGFSARVIRMLPAPDALPAWRRPFVVGLWLVAATLVAMMLPAVFFETARQVVTLFAARPFSLSSLGLGVVALGVAMWTCAAMALRRD
ncbi:MAG TPA: hypothetical protein VJ891_09945 [Casimicrobiaceae bacterium]|nr:hypothetical protein [Casimicrobiaceae bacterium]